MIGLTIRYLDRSMAKPWWIQIQIPDPDPNLDLETGTEREWDGKSDAIG